ncbi:hypothetical protein Cgig2_001980 [Carnegiea gigantea]|uniref:DUF4283 domain-containing protein n=1 Tax=Carnegiea gigantea TaxID=171969 RepID=A0A9Q1QBS5_9CARY|nr:hypothetical protein Cgig2_001980 [Carnegiea gigantea]
MLMEEEQVVVYEEDESEEPIEKISWCLWGKLLTENFFNPWAMKPVLKNIWKLARGVIIRELDKNLFSFQFFSSVDKEHVLNEGPWAFDGHLLLLKEITGLEQPTDVEFDTTRFLVKVLGSQLGPFLSCDEANLYCGADKSVNYQVEIDITKLLRRGVLTVVRENSLWIGLGYIKLLDFYYRCGSLGILKGCDVVDPDLEVSELQYDKRLRASPASKTRLQLKFEDQWSQKRNQGLSDHGREDMMVNEARIGCSSFMAKENSGVTFITVIKSY